MTITDAAVPLRCTCPHFENEHAAPTDDDQPRPCRAGE